MNTKDAFQRWMLSAEEPGNEMSPNTSWLKSEIRMSKSETNQKHEIQNILICQRCFDLIRIYDFLRI